MDSRYDFNGLLCVWDEIKAKCNAQKHGIRFEEACEVFFDPFFLLINASRHDKARDAVIGRATRGAIALPRAHRV